MWFLLRARNPAHLAVECLVVCLDSVRSGVIVTVTVIIMVIPEGLAEACPTCLGSRVAWADRRDNALALELSPVNVFAGPALAKV